jgi:hypothetical protein
MNLNTHMVIAKIPVQKRHVKFFCGSAGFALMAMDACAATIFAHLGIQGLEDICSVAGKCGATLSGFMFFIEAA